MHHWKETAEIVARLTGSPERAALATVVRVEGSAYRRPGAKMLVSADGGTLGSVSGGCLEADVREVAASVVQAGRPVLRHYDNREDDVIGLGLGCNGLVDIFVQPTTGWPITALAALLAGDSPVTITTELATGVTTASPVDARTSVHDGVFTEGLQPPPYLLICGAGSDTAPLAAYATDAGFRVMVAGHDEIALPSGARTLAVVKTRSYSRDREWVRRLLDAGLPYIGVLGPKARTQRMLREICGVASVPRVFGPVGLDIGADGPHQVAISIVAELLGFIAHREPRHLGDRRVGIHDDE